MNIVQLSRDKKKNIYSILEDTHDYNNINNINNKKYNDNFRFEKRVKYNSKRDAIIENLIYPKYINHSDIIEVTEWYDLFMDYATMELLNETKFWFCMRKLGYRFSKWNTILHHYLFTLFCTSKKPMLKIVEFLLSILVLKNKIPTIIHYSIVIKDLFCYLKNNNISHIFDQLPYGVLYHKMIKIDNQHYNYDITKEILTVLYSKLGIINGVDTLLFTLFEWE